MTDKRPRLTTRGRTTAEHIRDCKPFTTSGALSAQITDGLSNWDSGRLYGEDLDQFRADCTYIRYVVYSYSTPIAWWTGTVRGWYVVKGRWSTTTSKHQGNLYLIPQPTLDIPEQ
jgi:hypothetical protein